MKKITGQFLNKTNIVFISLLYFNPFCFAQENGNILTLETAMNMAENYAFSSRIATNNKEINEYKTSEKFRGMLPNVSLSGNYLKYSDNVNKAVGTASGTQYGFPNSTVSSASISVTQPLVGLIPLYLSLQSAAAQTEMALKNEAQAKKEARFLGANSYINAVKAAQLLAVAQTSVTIAQTQLKDGQAQLNAGKLTNADVLKFKLNLENAKTNYIQAQTTAKITLLTLSETTGIKNSSLLKLPSNYNSVWANKKFTDLNLDEFISKALTTRNDILAASSAVKSAKYNKYATESSYLPSLNFVANYSRNLQAKDINVPAITIANQTLSSAVNYSKSDIQDNLYYGLQLSWNIIDWGVRQAQISQAVEGESIAGTQLEQVESQIKIDVTNNFLKLQDAFQNLDSAKVSVEYAKDVYSQMEAQFNNGQATTTDVLAASGDQTLALAKFANAVGDLDIAWLSFQKSIGNRLTTLDK
jgi:outer membrane protein